MKLKSFLATLLLLAVTSIHASAQAPAPTIANPITINVLGAVNRPARCVLPTGATVLDALAAAGGAMRVGDLAKVRIIRRNTDGKTDTTLINVKNILNGQAKDVPLRDGDTLNVPETLF